MVDEPQRVADRVEEKDIGQAKHDSGHRQGDHAHQLDQAAPVLEALAFFHQVGSGEDDGGADHRGPRGHFQAVPEGPPAAAVHEVELVAVEHQAEVIGPELDQGGELGDGQDTDDDEGDGAAESEHGQVETAVRLGLVRHGAGRQQGHLLALDHAVGDEGEQGGGQQHQADHRPHLEVPLADHLFVDVHRQHVVTAADHLGHAEVGDDQGEDDETGADQAVLGPRQGDGEEGPQLARAQGLGGLVQPGVGQGQGGENDEKGVGERPEHLADDDADGPVNGFAHQKPLDHALGAEQVAQRNRRQQRRRQDGDQGDGLEHALARNAAAGQPVGVPESEPDGDDHADDRDGQAVIDRIEQRRRGEILGVIVKPDKESAAVLEALGQDGVQGKNHGHQQVDADDGEAGPHHPVFAADLGLYQRSLDDNCLRAVGHGDFRPYESAKTRIRSAGKATVRVLPASMPRSRTRLTEKSAWNRVFSTPLAVRLAR